MIIEIPTISITAWASMRDEDTTEFQENWLDSHFWFSDGYPLEQTPGEWDRAYEQWRES